MRLDKITIGSPKDSPTHRFKNLKDVTIDFDQNHWITVVIGWNGTGKSNVLEALTIIFRDLIQGNRKPDFAYNLTYRMGSSEDTLYINVDADPDRAREPLMIHVATESEARGDGTLIPFIEDELETSPMRGKKKRSRHSLTSQPNICPTMSSAIIRARVSGSTRYSSHT
ncbi:AAA family ATPase [Nioella sp. MMSF_3534]|uniref:AAA family ATPase n=1 Tax=Nioella sp. MMSF_3534 TaxID=3046720 RepID=UPI00273DC65D|nr:AAA family ATPase [Nioella sp. MMSF_3534]